MNSRIETIVTGRVQMVMFRDFVRRKARSLGLSGTVENLDDGTVKVIAQGKKENLEELIKQLNKGPLLAKVARVEVEWYSPRRNVQGFRIIY